MTLGPVGNLAQAGDLPTEPHSPVLFLPAKADVFSLGVKSVARLDDSSDDARANIDTATLQAATESRRFRRIELPELSADERAVVDEFLAVSDLVFLQMGSQAGKADARIDRADIDRTLGPSLAFLRERTGADFALGGIGRQMSLGADRLGLEAGLRREASLLTFQFDAPVPTGSYAGLYLVDLRTGELQWFNFERVRDVAGIRVNDLTNLDWVRAAIADALKPYPSVPRLADAPASSPAKARAITPMQGEFAVTPPAGWLASEKSGAVTATLDGSLLNFMRVELRPHDVAFPASGRGSRTGSTPQQLAEQYIADLRAQPIGGLTIIESVASGQLAGRPAFRVRFSYVPPVGSGTARIEQVTIGTAVSRGLLLAQLLAPQLHYFEKALPAFAASAQTIVLRPPRHLQ